MGTPKGSPASRRVQFTIRLSGLSAHLERQVTAGTKALSFVDDVAWIAEDKDENDRSATQEAVASAAQQLAEQNAVIFENENEATDTAEQANDGIGGRNTC